MASVSLSELLAENLTWLMSQVKELSNSTQVAAKAKEKGRPIGQRTVHRASKGVDQHGKEIATTTETLEAIAVAYGLEPWQLLHPGMKDMYAQRQLTLEDEERVRKARELIAEMSPAAQLELFGNSETAREIGMRVPATNDRLVEKGWSAAGKAVSRKTG